MQDVKAQFENHLASLGYEPRAPRNVILQKLRQRMGEKRYHEIFGERNGPPSPSAQEEFYKNFQDLIEGNLMRSLDPCATLDASYALYQHAASRLIAGARVIELGCWTGGLASFIASRHADCSVVGVDLSRKITDACNAYYRLPNLRFQQWHYRFGKPEDLELADVLLCSMGVVHHMPDNSALFDPAAIRRSREYVTQRDEAIGYFGLWRLAAKEGATLFAVLRLQLMTRFLAWIDAAQQTRWTPRLDLCWGTELKGEGSVLPGMAFEAKATDALSEDEVLECWTRYYHRGHLFSRQEGAVALAGYRAMGSNKEVLAKRQYRHNGLLTQDEVGLAFGVGYVFSHNAVSKFRLLFVSASRAKQLQAGIPVKGSHTPITDDAVFQGAAAVAKPTDAKCASPFFSRAPIATPQDHSIGTANECVYLGGAALVPAAKPRNPDARDGVGEAKHG